MKLRKRYLPVAAVLGAAVVMVPALAAGPSEAKLEVNENCVENNWPCWNAGTPGSESPASKVTIAPGGKVKSIDHGKEANIKWTSTPSGQPTCSSEVPVSPMPAKTGWEGTCEFEQPGTYRFESSTLFKDAYENYTEYEIVVENARHAAQQPPRRPQPRRPRPQPRHPPQQRPPPRRLRRPQPHRRLQRRRPRPPPSPPAAGPPRPRRPARSKRLPRRAGVVPSRRSRWRTPSMVTLCMARSRFPPPTAARVWKCSCSPRAPHWRRSSEAGSSRVGRLVRSSAPAGTVSFTVSLDAQAKRALRHHHKLALTVKIVLTPKHGAAMTLTRSVVVR